MNDHILTSFNALKSYCEKEAFKGYDPYDSLNSTFFAGIPWISKVPLARLVWTQFFKRSPFNLRRIAGIHKEYNPKALGLFISGYCLLYRIRKEEEYLDKIRFLTSEVLKLRNQKYSNICWGYNFDWQSRAFFQPKHTPTVVASTFIANALLDAYDITKDPTLISAARSSCNFILNDLNRTYDDKGHFAFSYSPMDRSVVFNASLLGSRILSRVYSYTGEDELAREAGQSVHFCCDHQKKDGSWSYGTLPFHQWVDNFHTGYNLECIADYMKFARVDHFENQLNMGYHYYISTFFSPEGIPKYYNNSVYPIDIHSSAQLIITLSKLNRFHEQKLLIEKVLGWTIKNMQSDKGYFYYQINKLFSSKIPYMRWGQAWMFYSMAMYLFKITQSDK